MKFWVGPFQNHAKPGKAAAWGVDYKPIVPGKARRKTWGSNKKHAERCLRKLVRELEDGTHTAASTKTFGDALDAYEKRCEHRHKLWVKAGKPSERSKQWLAGATVYRRRTVIKKHVRPALGPYPLADLTTRDHLQPLINDLAEQANATHVVAFLVIDGALELAVDSGWLMISPTTIRKIDVPPPPRRKTSIPEIEEGRVIWLTAQERGREGGTKGEHKHTHVNRVAMIALAMFGGVEAGATTALQWQDIDWVNGSIHLSRSWSFRDQDKGMKNKYRVRTIPMSEEIRTSLAAIWERDGRPNDGYVFYTLPGRGGTRWSVYDQVSKSLKSAQRRAGFVDETGKERWRYHDMRHYAGSVWIEAGKRLGIGDIRKFVADLLGHKNTKMVDEVYGHIFEKYETKRRREVIDAASDLHRLPGTKPVALPAPIREKFEIEAEAIEIAKE